MIRPAGPVARLRELLDSSRRMVVFTGAGISTESGIPDFRSPGGIWSRFQPIYFRDFIASEEMRREYWDRRYAMEATLANAEPNRGHRAIANLVRRNKISSVITQNVDGLHQESGVPNDQVIELHGNTTYATCLDCAERVELDKIWPAFLADGTLPVCETCGGLVKPATISFGQTMPVVETQQAEVETLACDLFLTIGSSLVVYPAAGFPVLAKQNGARLVILNRENTGLDEIADLVLHREIGVTLGDAVGVN